MIQIENISNVTDNSSIRWTESKTVHKFTGDNQPNALPQCVSVNLDGLSFMVECYLPEPHPESVAIELNPDVVIEYKRMGTKHFKHSYEVFLFGEPVANIHTHTRNPKIIKPSTAKLEIQNHVLYSTSVIDVLKDVMAACQCPNINNISSLHIAIDGANRIPDFLDRYAKQDGPDRDGPKLRTLGKYNHKKIVKKGKASFTPKMKSATTGKYLSYKIGGSRKSVVVYNKSSELEKSRKEYIRKSWEMAGLDLAATNWRCELRMDSQAVKEIKDLELAKLNDPNYLLQIFRTQAENFFDFCYLDNGQNISRATSIDLLQFHKLKIPLMEKIPRAIVRGCYKAQMGIHNAYANILIGVHDTREKIETALKYIHENVMIYNLNRWFEKKKQDWQDLYRPDWAFG